MRKLSYGGESMALAWKLSR